MQRIVLAFIAVAMAGCATPPAPQTPQEKKAAESEQLINEMLSRPLVADSVFRDGDKLSFQVLKPASSTNALTLTAQLEAACSSPQVNLLYFDGSATGRTYLGVAHGNYGPAQRIVPRFYPVLSRNPGFSDACSDLPQPGWRVVKSGDNAPWVMVDLLSFKTRGSENTFWAAYDNPTVVFSLPYNAPQAQRREHYALDCDKQTFRVLARYDLNTSSSVTDGQVDPTPTVQPIKTGTSDETALFKMVCDTPGQLGQLPEFKPRDKQVSVITPPPVMAPALLAVTQLGLPAPRKQLSTMTLTGSMTLNGTTAPLKEQVWISRDVSGQLAIREHSDRFDSSDISWRGLIPLAHKSIFSTNTFETQTLSNLSFSGNWQEMPVGSRLSYSGQGSRYGSVSGEYGKEPWTVECNVDRDLQAHEVNTSLSGGAKALSCSTQGDKLARVSHFYYLMDYGFFYEAWIDKNPYFYNDRHIESVK